MTIRDIFTKLNMHDVSRLMITFKSDPVNTIIIDVLDIDKMNSVIEYEVKYL